MASYQRRYFSRRGGKVSPIHCFVGFTVLFCFVSMILVRHIWITEKDVYMQDLLRNYFFFGDPANNCLIHFDPGTQIHLKPLSMILRHLRRYGATGLIVPLQDTLENMAEGRSADGADPLEDVLDLIPPSEATKYFVDFFAGAAKENLTVVPICPNPRSALFYLYEYAVQNFTKPLDLDTCCNVQDKCLSTCLMRMAGFFDKLYAVFTAHELRIPAKILIKGDLWSYGMSCLETCRADSSSAEDHSRGLQMKDASGDKLRSAADDDDKRTEVQDFATDIAQAGSLIQSKNTPPTKDINELVKVTTRLLKHRYNVTAVIDVSEISYGWSWDDRIAFLKWSDLKESDFLIDTQDPGFQDFFYPAGSEDSLENERLEPSTSDDSNSDALRPLRSVELLPRLTLDVSWKRGLCHQPFPSTKELTECIRNIVDLSWKDVVELRKRLFRTRNSAKWTGTVLRIHGTELAMLPFSLELATAGTALLRTGMPLENLLDLTTTDPMSCNFLLKNPEEVRRQMVDFDAYKKCERAHGMRLVMDIMYTIRLMHHYEVSCDDRHKEFSWTEWFSPNEDACDDLRNRACRMRREVFRDMREWHPAEACDLWMKQVLTIRTIQCPEEDLELFRHVVKVDDKS